MPIRRKDYPKNWSEISHRIRVERAGNQCEDCGVDHHAVGYRDRGGNFIQVYLDDLPASTFIPDITTWEGLKNFRDLCNAKLNALRVKNGQKRVKFMIIILTVAHLNHDRKNNSDENLKALCQRDHLNNDRGRNTMNRRYGKNFREFEVGDDKYVMGELAGLEVSS